ncbi:hypothetical protein IC575_019295 [Cucumis melo]
MRQLKNFEAAFFTPYNMRHFEGFVITSLFELPAMECFSYICLYKRERLELRVEWAIFDRLSGNGKIIYKRAQQLTLYSWRGYTYIMVVKREHECQQN